jgi:hypothetical protein
MGPGGIHTSIATVAAGDMPMMHVDGIGNAYVPGQIIVRFRPGAARSEIAKANRAKHKREMRLERTVILEVPVGEEFEIARNLVKNPNVEFAEVDYALSVVPCETGDCTDTEEWFFGRKWDLHNDGQIITNLGTPTVAAVTGKPDADMDWLEAYTYLGPDFDGSAVIGILDTGIRHTHGDLAGKVIAARNFAIGYPEDLIEDRDGHGTHVAGIAAASGALAMSGVAYGKNIKLISAKVCELYLFPDGSVRTSCPSSSTAEAIVWATDQGANVLNMSLGGPWTATAGFAAQQTALRYARSHNVLPFCASGNDAREPGYEGTETRGVGFPARFPECVAVGSTDWFDNRSSFSSWGPQVELSAPGGQVFANGGTPWGAIFSLSNSADNTYTYKQGTSMAAPQAAGLAGLLFATGMTDANEVLQRMMETAEDLGAPGRDPHFGYGRINVYRALTQQDPAIAMSISTRSNVQLRSNGNLQVVLLDREAVTFGLNMVDIGSIRLENTGTAVRPNGSHFATWSDVDRDGRADLVLHFSIPEMVRNGDLTARTTELMLHASLNDGRTLRGIVGVNVR